ncbi:MAG: PASTA domain-containing protein [Acidobacteria bacterium]|nr:PASTA domain-containing protein [Acidobacteriota bacterium]
MRAFFRFVLRALLLIVVFLVSMLTAMRFAIHGREVAVPDLLSKTPSEAQRLSEAEGLQVEIERQYFSPNVPEGRILSQAPPAGSKVRRGWQIRVAQSLGPQRVEIPSVLGQSQRVAEINIRRRGLEIAGVALIAMPGADPDQVLSQSPPPSASGISAPKISLLVSGPAATQAVVMPSFVGQPMGTVRQTLEDAGFHLGTVAPAAADSAAPSSAPAAASIVVSQTPPAGEKVLLGATINFQVR